MKIILKYYAAFASYINLIDIILKFVKFCGGKKSLWNLCKNV